LWYYHNVEFIEARIFTKRLHQLVSEGADDVLLALQEDLRRMPERGALVPGLAGIRKARVANPARGKGKRGGFRYLYVYYRKENQIALLYLLDKDEQADLTATERKLLREIVGRG
jgi:hypothetical protein